MAEVGLSVDVTLMSRETEPLIGGSDLGPMRPTDWLSPGRHKVD
jgi:hypothetical protein